MYIQLKNCTFSYGKKNIINNLSLDLNKGEILAVIGSNGIGKTTLLKCLTKIEKWDSGKFLINNSPEHKDNIFGYVSQAKKMPFSYTVLDFVMFGRSVVNSYFASPTKIDYEACYKILEQLNITQLQDRPCNELSGGELQMVFLAKALVSDPEILVLDEPESNLDFYNQLKLLDIIKSICKEKNTTVIINSHFINNVAVIADKFLLLKEDGYTFGDYEKVLTYNNIAKYFKVKSKQVDIQHNDATLKHLAFLECIE